MSGEQGICNLEIKKKSGLRVNPDIHHSKVSMLCTVYNPMRSVYGVYCVLYSL